MKSLLNVKGFFSSFNIFYAEEAMSSVFRQATYFLRWRDMKPLIMSIFTTLWNGLQELCVALCSCVTTILIFQIDLDDCQQMFI